MTLRKMLINPNPELRETSVAVAKEDITSPEIKGLICDLKDTMAVENGIGIAAPQIGILKQIIIIGIGEKAQAFINPKIVSRSFRKIVSEEGCLSVPGIFGIVKRSRAVKVKAFNEAGEEVVINVQGMPAVVFQHEIDHLAGVLFIDKVIKYTDKPKL